MNFQYTFTAAHLCLPHVEFNFSTPTVKRQVTRQLTSLLTFDSMYRTLKCDHSLKSCSAVLYCGAACKPFDSQSEILCDTKFSNF